MAELAAFEAAARLQSFTAAATELHLTQSAISRQIRSLEDQLGGALFAREKQAVKLTIAGQSYAQEIRAALQRIGAATLAFKANPLAGTLNLAVLPTLGTRWLVPRLPRFLSAHPEVAVNLTTRLSRFDFQSDSMDAAIHYGAADWPGAEHVFLMREQVVPACSPGLASTLQITRAEDLLQAPLLHLATRPNAWEQWFGRAGVAVSELHGMLVDQFSLAAQAGSAGLGIALLPRFLIERELADGSLVVPVAIPSESEGRYYLTWPAGRSMHAPLLAFKTWLVNECQTP